VDLPSIWHEGNDWRPWHHWDGNTADGVARSYAAVVGVGGTAESIRRWRVKELTTWIDHTLTPLPFPFLKTVDPDGSKGRRGKDLFTARCSCCHGNYEVTADGRPTLRKPAPPCMTGNLDGMKASQVGTDTFRAAAADDDFTKKLDAFGAAQGLWTLNAFRRTQLYQCPPLDGIWARAPYLHNGSVPTLRALLGGKRPRTFLRGSAEYLPFDGGFEFSAPPNGNASSGGSDMMDLFVLDTKRPGNGNEGHDLRGSPLVGPPIVGADFDDLLAYLYTL
jgi:hypothetical protein